MGKPPEYPLTFAEATEIANNGGTVTPKCAPDRVYEKQKGCWWYKNAAGDNIPVVVMFRVHEGMWRVAKAAKKQRPEWELQDYEIGKD